MDHPWLIAGVSIVIAIIAAGVLAWRPIRSARRESQLARAQASFHRQRERLEAKFFQLASSSGKPRGLAWTDCDFEDDVTYARDRKSGELSAFVAVAISFEAVEGGGMEEVEAVSNVRAATAVFHFREGQWSTDGRAIFNLNPGEAVQYYKSSLEPVVQH